MKYYTILLLLGLIMPNGDNLSAPSLARAETVIQDLGEEIEKTPDEGAEEKPKSRAPPTPTMSAEEREKIKKEKRATKRKLESCLVMTRSHYKLYEDKFDSYLREHKSTQGMKKAPSGGVTADTPKDLKKEIEQGRNNHSMLLSKINGQMLLQCDQHITKEQIKVLQKHKKEPEAFDALTEGYAKLVEIDLAVNDDVGLTGAKLDGIGRVVYSNAESKVLQQIEDINASMNRDQKTLKSKKQKSVGVNIAGFETSDLSKGQQIILMIVIYAGVMAVLYYLYQRWFSETDSENAERNAFKAKKEQKRANKKKN